MNVRTLASLSFLLLAAGCGGSSSGSRPPAASTAAGASPAPIASASSASPAPVATSTGTAGGSGTTAPVASSAPLAGVPNGTPTQLVTPSASVLTGIYTRLRIKGNGFVSPVYVELTAGSTTVHVEATVVAADELELILPYSTPPATYALRVGAGSLGGTVLPLLLASAPALSLTVDPNPGTAGIGELVHARGLHTSVLLPTGEVLVVGGRGARNATLAAVEVFDPLTNRCRVVGQVPPRGAPGVVVLDSGRVLIVGGGSLPEGGPPSSIWAPGPAAVVFDPANGHVEVVQGLPTIGMPTVVAMPGDRALVLGVEAYVVDAAAATATRCAQPQERRFRSAAVWMPSLGEVAVFGGDDAWTSRIHDTGERYDPLLDRWTPIPGRMLQPRYAPVAGLEQGLVEGVLLVGGQPQGAPDSVETWDPVAGYRSHPAVLPVAYPAHAATHPSGALASFERQAAGDRLWFGTRALQLSTPLATPRPYLPPTLTFLDADRVAVLGGSTSGGYPIVPLSAVEVVSLAALLPTGPVSPPIAPGGTGTVVAYGESLTTGGNVAYVLDISGSMGWDVQSYVDLSGQTKRGTRLERATTELARSVIGLDPSIAFNVHLYDCGTVSWSQGASLAGPNTRSSAVSFLFAARPTGATGTGPAVAHALSDKSIDTVILVTDGAPNCGAPDMAGHMALIRAANTQGAEVHVFGMAASGAYEQFLRDIAAQSGGIYRPVP